VISPLRFAITSRPSRCEEDLHLQAVEHARHTNEKAAPSGAAFDLNEAAFRGPFQLISLEADACA
jgi:hypothetical protein